MAGVNVKSEIKPLKRVLLHRPGNELLNLTPNTLEELLFDDIPFLKVAQEEHDAFAQALRDNGVEVVYLEDLMTEVLDQNPEVREPFLKQFIEEAGIRTDRYQKIIFDYLNDNYPNNKDLVLKTMEGINLTELHTDKSNSLVDLVSEASKMVVAPMPNLYFTRDNLSLIHIYRRRILRTHSDNWPFDCLSQEVLLLTNGCPLKVFIPPISHQAPEQGLDAACCHFPCEKEAASWLSVVLCARIVECVR